MTKMVLLILALAANSAGASVIVLVGPSQELIQVTHDANHTWKLNDFACLSKPKDWDEDDEYKAPCGWVVMTTFRGAVVKFPVAPDDLEKGRGVEVGQPPLNAIAKAEAARREVELRHWQEMFPFYNRLLNGSGESAFKDSDFGGSSSSEFSGDSGMGDMEIMVGVGMSLFRPKGIDAAATEPGMGLQILPSLVTFQGSIDTTASFGVTFLYSSFADGALSGKNSGIIVSFHNYSEQIYRGLWYQVGAGLMSTKGETDGALTYSSYMALGTAGYRYGGKLLNVGAGAGLSVVYAPNIEEVEAGLLQFLPAVMFDLSFRF